MLHDFQKNIYSFFFSIPWTVIDIYSFCRLIERNSLKEKKRSRIIAIRSHKLKSFAPTTPFTLGIWTSCEDTPLLGKKNWAKKFDDFLPDPPFLKTSFFRYASKVKLQDIMISHLRNFFFQKKKSYMTKSTYIITKVWDFDDLL